ncbi:GH36-type glycosyl hydrolase domain-containing protein [Zeimonas arvi]|uniref:Glycosyl transferase n=1 Tax=Zeimonas arvi TaxID=2498847 RepID=A0A5C8P3D5_9BURK|nr:glucoamylase family protein [Zeimonas arvi]TXL68166.1 glycosyl transferase [Zeimonas arvi]
MSEDQSRARETRSNRAWLRPFGPKTPAFRRDSHAAPWHNEAPIRADLFSIERLEQHAESLAASQPVTDKPKAGRSLAARLADDESVLREAYRTTASAAAEGEAITPAAEWLLDNYHLVDEQIREIRNDLPPGYYRQLPKLADGPLVGFPRVFGLAWAFVAHTDSHFEPGALRRFVRAYQRIQPLTTGELWAIAITLRILLIENLRRSARRLVTSRAARREADALADRILGVDTRPAEPIVEVLARRDDAPLPAAFAAQLVQRLRDQDPKVMPALAWLDERLAAQGTTADAIVHDEHQSQGAANVTVRNIITSMRLISDVDWADFVESVSLVDDVLRAGSEFADMDFSTRNLYRDAIEELAQGSRLTELDVARAALKAASDAALAAIGDDAQRRVNDPGYHLIAGGRRAFEATIGYRPPLLARPGRFSAAAGLPGYIAVVALVAALVLCLPLLPLARLGIGGWHLALLALVGAIPAIDAAMALVNRGVTQTVGAAILPGLELRDGVHSTLRTLIAVPMLLTTRADVEELVEALEIHHLSSPDGELHYALLSDWTDADAENVEGDEALVDAAAAGIARLNRRYGPAAGGERFLLLHRRRVWNEGQGRWIGWERKRGKLHELNRLLRGATDTTFMIIDGQPPAVPPGVRYVITLDADTRMPRDTARRLIGKMAHPLNRPRFDASSRRVVEGYGILQPRVTPSLPIGDEGSIFQRLFAAAGGIDPYAAAVSDVYQDLFGEGSYTGKGIYDVDAFAAALDGRVGESMLLSHDLFEGSFARSGLASDIEIVEEFPARYDVATARQHRWARGDWQLAPWILGRGHAADGDRRMSTVPPLGRWKMLDNLRRSLSAPVALAALMAGWALPLWAAVTWTGFVAATIAVSTLLPVLAGLTLRHSRLSARSRVHALATELRLALSQTALLLVFLAHQAWLMADAIGRTLFRLIVSHRHLLDWVTAAQAKVGRRLELAGFYRQMSRGVAIGVAAAIFVWLAGRDAWPVAAPFVFAWLASPAVARWSSLSPGMAERPQISLANVRTLRQIARRTWRYFENFVTTADNMLPPDNFQEDPHPAIAHRTSPTNIGLYLLSAVSARDFGWAGTADTVGRIESTLATMNSLPRFRGHFYNWYDTRALCPLDPKYISSVDSGNLAGHLIALANACREWSRSPIALADSFAGIDDNLSLARAALRALPDDRRTQTITRHQLEAALDALSAELGRHGMQPARAADPFASMSPQAATAADIARTLASERGDDAGEEMLFWVEATQRSIASHCRDLAATGPDGRLLERRLTALEAAARSMANAMEFGFLLDADRKLLSIGYRVAEDTLDPSCYDLLASEAHLASFVAIAKGDVPSPHWFRLGRAVTTIGHGVALISWSGSMFEYLMPSLVMRAPIGSLLEQSNRLIVRRQIAYGAERGVPWGLSESAYNVRDLEFTYQYSNFGIPGLGLKRGLGENIVVAPYATALAAMVDAEAATRNFSRLDSLGAQGRFGFYEALDYTRARLPKGSHFTIVRTFMAHHQGMTVVALSNALLDGIMRSRFHAEPIIQATELLLQERTPRNVEPAHPRAEEVATAATARDLQLPAVRRLRSPHHSQPQSHLLSNGRYTVMLTAAGSGYSRCGDIAVTRWREDATRDDWGSYVFLRDAASGAVWSAGCQPSGVEPDDYVVTFNEDRAEFVRHDGTIATTLEVIVSQEGDAEVRRVSVSNTGNRSREIDLTSYAEIVLAPPAADAAHPAFSKLFVQTEHLVKDGAILATRRRRSPGEPEIWAAHFAVVEGEAVGDQQIETDRVRFLGREREIRAPIAVMDGRPLSNTVGAVLDPVFALRRRLRIAPGRTARIAFWTVVAPSRSDLLDLIDSHNDTTAYDRAATLAWTQAQVQMNHLGIDEEQAIVFQRLAGHVIYADSSMRSSSDTIRRGIAGPPALWAQGISGDIPIVLLRIDSIDDIGIVRELLRAHEWWRMKQLAVDLVILNERASSYTQDLQIALETQIRTSQSRPSIRASATSGSVIVLRTDLIAAQTRALLLALARVVLVGRRGGLSEQLSRVQAAPSGAPAPRRAPSVEAPQDTPAVPALEYFNGFGGFAADGRAYVTILDGGRSIPAPWVNVIANPSFGFQVAVEGSGYTWSLGSRENQLTPWSNDPVTDRPGEVIYLRDEDSGELWGPTAQPIRHPASPYVATHGQGYSRFEHTAHGIELDLIQYVPLEDPVKISRLSIRNRSGRSRRLSVTAYVEWVLGPSRAASAPSIVTDIDAATGAMFARNPWNMNFGSRVAFADLCGQQIAWTADRREFLGRNGSLDNPAALTAKVPLSKRVGAALDPCGALQAPVELAPGGTAEIVFFLGQASTAADAQSLITRYRAADLDAVLREVVQYWDELLGTVKVKTPDRSMDIMLNRWLLYQTLACRVWARSAFYQASGAYGFRDQLQDSMALAVARPALTREHLLRAAGRQFVEGDFQHWWLPPSGQGVRTRISDDRVWLAYAAAHYAATTGDTAVLDESISFLEGQSLQPGEHDAYFQPALSEESASLFEHCARGLDLSLAVGAHGLPLIGTGDWNDGMNRVGEHGKGESVWLGWFLHATLAAFVPIAEARGEETRAARWLAHLRLLRESLERDGWDGDWYRRGYFDDGTPLGSFVSDECRIDSIAQSWSVLSGAGDPVRALRAMAAVDEQLIRDDDGLALLFTPPFDRTTLDPGYVKGYPPGVRENGGQYAHAAAWSVLALAALGQGDKAASLFGMVNPVSHTSTRADVQRYKLEPYVAAADVYSVAPHVGRGGWSWYTGAAGWLYRAGIEGILGFRLQGTWLLLDPCIPVAWPGFELAFSHQSTRYRIAVQNPHGVSRGVVFAELDGTMLPEGPIRVALVDDGETHDLRLTLG